MGGLGEQDGCRNIAISLIDRSDGGNGPITGILYHQPCERPEEEENGQG
jgi:hypothetical protein